MKLAMGGLSKEEVAQPEADFDYRIPLMAGTRKYGDTILLVIDPSVPITYNQ